MVTTPPVSVQVEDSDGADSNIATQDVTINNVAPTVSLSGTGTVNEGSTHGYSYTTSDPGDDTLRCVSVSCGANGDLSNSAVQRRHWGRQFRLHLPRW